MKNLFFIIGLMIISYLVHLIGPWWAPAIPAMIFGFLFREHSASLSFALGFVSLFLLWVFWSIYSDSINDGILSTRIGELFSGLGSMTLVIITGLIGGLLGGLGSISGNLMAKALK